MEWGNKYGKTPSLYYLSWRASMKQTLKFCSISPTEKNVKIGEAKFVCLRKKLQPAKYYEEALEYLIEAWKFIKLLPNYDILLKELNLESSTVSSLAMFKMRIIIGSPEAVFHYRNHEELLNCEIFSSLLPKINNLTSISFICDINYHSLSFPEHLEPDGCNHAFVIAKNIIEKCRAIKTLRLGPVWNMQLTEATKVFSLSELELGRSEHPNIYIPNKFSFKMKSQEHMFEHFDLFITKILGLELNEFENFFRLFTLFQADDIASLELLDKMHVVNLFHSMVKNAKPMWPNLKVLDLLFKESKQLHCAISFALMILENIDVLSIYNQHSMSLIENVCRKIGINIQNRNIMQINLLWEPNTCDFSKILTLFPNMKFMTLELKRDYIGELVSFLENNFTNYKISKFAMDTKDLTELKEFNLIASKIAEMTLFLSGGAELFRLLNYCSNLSILRLHCFNCWHMLRVNSSRYIFLSNTPYKQIHLQLIYTENHRLIDALIQASPNLEIFHLIWHLSSYTKVHSTQIANGCHQYFKRLQMSHFKNFNCHYNVNLKHKIVNICFSKSITINMVTEREIDLRDTFLCHVTVEFPK